MSFDKIEKYISFLEKTLKFTHLFQNGKFILFEKVYFYMRMNNQSIAKT
jgi:hypothetical protein